MFFFIFYNPLYFYILSLFGGLNVSPIFLLLLFFYFFLIIFKGITKNLISITLLLIFFLFCFVHMSSLYDLNKIIFSFTPFLQIFIGFSSLFYFENFFSNNKNAKKFMHYLIFFQIINIVIYFYFFSIGHTAGAFQTYLGLGITINRLMDWIFVPMLLIAFSFYNKLSKKMLFLIALLVIMNIIMTFTRTVIVSSVASVLIIFFLRNLKDSMYFLILAIPVISLFFIIAINFGLENIIFDRIFNIFATNEYDHSGSSRIGQLFDLKNLPPFGYGPLGVTSSGIEVRYTFSFFLNMIYSFGFLGIFITVCTISCMALIFIKLLLSNIADKSHYIFIFAANVYLFITLNLFPYNNYLPICLFFSLTLFYLIKNILIKQKHSYL